MAKQPRERRPTTTGTEVEELLAKLEKSLETPVVSGELSSWLTIVQESMEALLERLPEHYATQHEEQLTEMAEQDGGLLPRVDQLRQEDTEILAQAEQVRSYSQALQQKLDRSETGETALHEDQQEFAALGITWVVRARSQETAMETWYAEALERDRGVVD